MSTKEFYNTVASLREAQKLYFKTRTQYALTEAKRLEKVVDDEIKRYNEQEGKGPVQTELFT